MFTCTYKEANTPFREIISLLLRIALEGLILRARDQTQCCSNDEIVMATTFTAVIATWDSHVPHWMRISPGIKSNSVSEETTYPELAEGYSNESKCVRAGPFGTT
jgi:hypothetical protein